jgi:hypothetical protein
MNIKKSNGNLLCINRFQKIRNFYEHILFTAIYFLDFLHRHYVFQPQRFEGWLFPRNVVVEKHRDDGESPKEQIAVMQHHRQKHLEKNILFTLQLTDRLYFFKEARNHEVQ